MQTTITIDDTLLAKAKALTGLAEPCSVVHEALHALIARESARRLAAMGRTEPTANHPPRRRSRVR
jgi:Arc/MetJ family transcription regulator